jgi:hypothetical protein
MRSFIALFMMLNLVACTPSAEVTEGSSSGKSINQEAPFIWGNKTFPKTIRISSAFSATEISNMREMGTAWKTAVSDEKNFFSFGAPGNNNYNIEETDGVFGFYKATVWPADVSDDALAITQLFGRRYNVGDADEYVSIVEADILVNYQAGGAGFTYDTVDDDESLTDVNSDDGFDLRTIMLHEMGHFLGLQHIPTFYDRPDSESGLSREAYKATSVMYPSVSSLEEKRVPQTKDINALVNKYNIGGGGGAPAIIAASARFKPKNSDPGKNVKIVIELRKDGECLHKENGVVYRRHQVKLK